MRRMCGAVALAALLPAAVGCGIQETDVVEAGGGATLVVIPPAPDRMLLFLVDGEGRVRPVARSMGDPLRHYDTGPSSGTSTGASGPWETPGPGGETDAAEGPDAGRARVGAEKALFVLSMGPTDAERDAGLGSRLPVAGLPPVEIVEAGTEGGATRVRTRIPVQGLEWPAVQQIVCTAAYAESPTAPPEVVLAGPDGELPAARCE